MIYEKIVNESRELMKQKCVEKRKVGTLSKVHEESHMAAVATFGAATGRALGRGQGLDEEKVDKISDLIQIGGNLHDCERESTETVPHGPASAEFVLKYWMKNWSKEIAWEEFNGVYSAIKEHENSFGVILQSFGPPIQNGPVRASIIAHSIVAGDKAFEASGYRVLERRAFFVGKERTEKGDLKGIFEYPSESHLSVLGETMIRLYARNPIDEYPDWLKPFAQEWHAIQYQFYKGLLDYSEFDEVKAAKFFLEKKFTKFDQKLADQINAQQHLSGKYFDKEKYPILAEEIMKLNEMSDYEQQDLAASSFDIVVDIAIAESPEEAIEKYKEEKNSDLQITFQDKRIAPKNYYKFFDGIIAYREGSEEFVKNIEEKIRAEVEKISTK